MVTLPVYQAQVSADPGFGTFRQASTADPIGSAMEGFGQSLEVLGKSQAHYQARIDAAATAEAAKSGAITDGIAYQKFVQKDTELLLTSKEQADPAATDFTKNYAEARRKALDEFVSQVPPERRAEWELQLAKEETHAISQAQAFEHTRRESVLGSTLKNAGDQLYAMTSGGGDPVAAKEIAASKVRQLAGVVGEENSPRAVTLKSLLNIEIERGVLDRARASNPVALERELRARIVGTVAAKETNDPSIAAGIDAAQRYDIDPRLSLAIKGTEGGWGPSSITAKASKTIRGPWQISEAESRSVGMAAQHYSDDPAIQAEIAARVLKRNSADLSANGLDVNFYNMKGAHWLGMGGWIAANNADPNLSMRDFYARFTAPGQLDKVMRTNGWDNKTVGQVLGSVKGMEKSAMAKADSVLTTRGKPSDAPLVVNGYKIEHIANDQLPAFYSKTQADVSKLMDNTLTEMSKQKVALGDVNSANAHDREEVHKAGYAEQWDKRLLTGDDTALQHAVTTAKRDGMVDAATAAGVSKLMSSKIDIGQRAKGYEIGLLVHDADPTNGLQYSKFDDDDKRKIEQYAKLRGIPGMTPEEAIRRVDRINAPDFKVKTELLTQRIKDERPNRTYKELGDLKLQSGGTVATWGIFTSSNNPSDQRMKDYITKEYSDRFEYHMKDLGSDSTEGVSSAKAMAKWDMQRMLGVTKLSGRDEVTIYPPEKFYPPVVSADGKTKSTQYVQDQAVAFVKNQLAQSKAAGRDIGDVRPENVHLRPTATTASDIRRGDLPTYEVIYFTSKGQAEAAGEFRADPRQAGAPKGLANAIAAPASPAAAGKGLAAARQEVPAKTEEDAIKQNRAMSQW